MGWLLFFIAVIVALHFRQKHEHLVAVSRQKEQSWLEKAEVLNREIESLAKFKEIRDLVAEVERLRLEAEAVREAGRREAEEIRRSATADAKARREKAEQVLADANRQADRIIQAANEQAEKIGGDAYRALKEADALAASVKAMENLIKGYGDRYLKPTYSLLDELADNYSHESAGRELKAARERSALMVEHGRAAACDYVEANRRETAIQFVIDAFNGKVDSILSRSKSDNYGTLEQQIKDAYSVVNHLGNAFRNARITTEYLQARLDELKWAASVQALREKDKEEQRRIREQIREEEKARREYERAMKEAAKEEDMLRKAMEKVQAQVAKASEEQKAKYEQQLLELQARFAEAEAKNQRALSMAQQTKAGHVYVISNIGSFGENVFKVGMTRRLEPLDRVKELGDASVPFSFDVHALIWSEDAPALEHKLHRVFVESQINKVNPRKEFFRIGLTDIRRAIEGMGIEASWTMAAAALEYHESLAVEKRIKEDEAAKEEWLRHQEEVESAEERQLDTVAVEE